MSWPMVKLGDVCNLINGDRGKNYPSKDALFSEGVPFINAGNLQDDLSIKCSGANYITEDRFALLSNGKVQIGDILFCLRGSLGKFAIVGDDILQGAVASSLVIIRPKNRINRDYLKNYLRSTLCKREIERFENGAAQPNLSAKDLKEFEIPLPPLEEQKRIAVILDKADAIRRKRQQAIQLADDLLRAVFLDMFGDPVTNPKGWEVLKLSEITTFENGDRSSNYPSGDDVVSSGVLFLSTKNIVSDSLTLKSAQFISEVKYNSLSRGKAKRGDLIITLRGTLGACCIFDCEYNKAFINAQMMIIRAGDDVNNLFLHDWLVSKAIKNHLQKIGQGAAIPQLTAQQLKELSVPLPSKELQVAYAAIRESVYCIINKMTNFSKSDLLIALSQRAFTAQL